MRKTRQGRTGGVEQGGVERPSIVLPSGGSLTPALLDALTDKVKRPCLKKIHQSLKDFNQTEGVRYGVDGPTFTDIGELLETTA